ncbi:MAG: hypothetical protein Q7R43_02705 [Candidatus Daviesbacteria bacterium]|nr:hypothetical protein [Candidatus Daviesbacteria bacterium]
MPVTSERQISEETRELLLNCTFPQDLEEAEWEVGIRAKVEPLLLQKGELPYNRLRLSEEGIRQVLHPDPAKYIPIISQLERAIRGSEATQTQRLVNFLAGTPLREISVPFEDHRLIIVSTQPSLEREILLQCEAIASGKPLSIPKYSIGETLLAFTSTAWWLDKDFMDALILHPASIKNEIRTTIGVGSGMLHKRQRQQVEAIVEYVNNYYNSNSNTRRVK